MAVQVEVLNPSASNEVSPSEAVNLLQVCSEPVSYLGGVGLIVARLVGGLPKNYRVSLACPDANRATLPSQLQGRIEDLISIPGGKWSTQSAQEFAREVGAGNYDLLHLHGGPFSFDAHLPWRSPLFELHKKRVPWVYSNHCAPSITAGLFPDHYPFPMKLLKSGLALGSLGVLIAASRKQIFDSRDDARRLGRYFPWARRKLTTIYHSGLEGQPPATAMRDRVVTIANLGHIARRKGQHDLLEAFCLVLRKFPDLQLVLAGPDGGDDCALWIRKEVVRRKLEGRVHLPGGIKDLGPFWSQVDLYVQPSHWEGAPMALMEALWQSKPSVGTQVSGIPEIIEHEKSGLLVPVREPAALAEALERLILEPETRKRFALAGPGRIQKNGMTRPQMVERHLEIYAEALHCTRRRRGVASL